MSDKDVRESQNTQLYTLEKKFKVLEARMKEVEEANKKLLKLCGIEDSVNLDLSALDTPQNIDVPKLNAFKNFVANKLYLFFLMTEETSFHLLKTDTKTAADKFYNHLNKIISSVPAIGTIFKGLETGEVAASIADDSTQNYASPLPLEIPAGYATPLQCNVTSIEIKRRLQALHVATELTLQYQDQLSCVAKTDILTPAHYATYAIVRYLVYYLRRKAKNKTVYDLSISSMTDAVTAHRQDNPFAQQVLTLEVLSQQPHAWQVGGMFSATGIVTDIYYSCDLEAYTKDSISEPHGLAMLYGYRKLSLAHAEHFMKQTATLTWHVDSSPKNQRSLTKRRQALAPLQTENLKQQAISILTPSSQKISKALVKIMSLLLFVSSVTLVLLGVAAIKDGGFLSDIFSSVTHALGLNALSGSIILAAGISLMVLLGVTYLCLWLEDEKPPTHPSYDTYTKTSTSSSSKPQKSYDNQYRAPLPQMSNPSIDELPNQNEKHFSDVKQLTAPSATNTYLLSL